MGAVLLALPFVASQPGRARAKHGGGRRRCVALGAVGKRFAVGAIVALAALAVFTMTRSDALPDCAWIEWQGEWVVLAECTREGDGWVMEHVRLEGDAELRVVSGVSVVLRDVRITKADDVRLNLGCACSVRGEEFVIEGTGSAGIWVYNAQYPPRDGIGSTVKGASLDGLSAMNVGRFLVSDVEGTFALSNITLSCPPSHRSEGMRLDPETTTTGFVLRDISIKYCGISMADHASASRETPVGIDILRLAVDEAEIGIAVRPHNAPLRLSLGESAIYNSTVAVQLGGASLLEGDIATTEFRGNGAAIQTNEEPLARLNISDSDFISNGFGIQARGRARALELDVVASRFLGNGAAGFQTESTCEAAVSGFVTGRITGSVFEGNTPALHIGFLAASTLDASGNWWGSPSGPTPSPFCEVNEGAGDVVIGAVVTEPHLTSPP